MRKNKSPQIRQKITDARKLIHEKYSKFVIHENWFTQKFIHAKINLRNNLSL